MMRTIKQRSPFHQLGCQRNIFFVIYLQRRKSVELQNFF